MEREATYVYMILSTAITSTKKYGDWFLLFITATVSWVTVKFLHITIYVSSLKAGRGLLGSHSRATLHCTILHDFVSSASTTTWITTFPMFLFTQFLFWDKCQTDRPSNIIRNVSLRRLTAHAVLPLTWFVSRATTEESRTQKKKGLTCLDVE